MYSSFVRDPVMAKLEVIRDAANDCNVGCNCSV